MPLYDYLCPSCGPISASRPMKAYAEPLECPTCMSEAPRAILQAPQMSGLSAEDRDAHGRNEKARHEPAFSTASDRSDRAKERTSTRHPVGCACCSGGGQGLSKAVYTADGSKTFPSKRPWMICH